MNMKRDIYEDVQLLKTGPARFWMLVLVVSLLIIPFMLPNYSVYLVNYMAINIIVAIGLNILVGYTGQISLGHAGFFAIGAYATALLMIHLSIPFLLALVVAGLIAGAFGFLLGLPALRLEGPYLAIATLGFGMAVAQIIARVPLFGGHMGIEAPALDLGPLTVKGDKQIYFVIMPIAFFLTLAARNIVRTRVGRALTAIRDSDVAAEALGVNIAYYKTLAFAISAFYAGIGGGLMVFVLGFINPNAFDLIMSIMFLIMVLVGGPGAILGSILGAVVITFLMVKLDTIQTVPIIGDFLIFLSDTFFSRSGLPNISNIIFGVILVSIIIFERMGLYGIWLRIKIYWRTWPF